MKIRINIVERSFVLCKHPMSRRYSDETVQIPMGVAIGGGGRGDASHRFKILGDVHPEIADLKKMFGIFSHFLKFSNISKIK